MANKIDQFFEVMVAEGGSDLHVSEGQPPKFRKHGDMTPLREEILTHQELDQILSEICRPKMWEKFKETGDLDFAYEM
ncbi:MAG: type IV pili twitching motility protein PilT, partial [Verrucomicrobiota bacterium]